MSMALIGFQDDADIDDTWSNPGRVSDVLKILEGWDPRCRAIVKPLRRIRITNHWIEV